MHLMNLMDDEELFYEQLSEQICMNSLIASKKFEYVNKTMKNRVYSFMPLMLGGSIKSV